MRSYEVIKKILSSIEYYSIRIYEDINDTTAHKLRTGELLKLWDEKINGRYNGELTAEHVLQSLTALITCDPENPKFRLWRGKFYIALADRANATSDYNYVKSLPVLKSALDAYLIKSELHDLETALKAMPATSSERESRAQPIAPLTIDDIKIQNLHGVIALADMKLVITPNDTESLSAKAFAYSQMAKLTKWDQAILQKTTEAYDAAIKNAPTDAMLFLKRAYSYIKQNHFDAGLQDLFNAMILPITSTDMHLKIHGQLKGMYDAIAQQYKGNSELEQAFKKLRTEKKINDATLDIWLASLIEKLQPMTRHDVTDKKIQFLQQQITDQGKSINSLINQIAELQKTVMDLQKAPATAGLSSPAAFFTKRDAATQTGLEEIAVQTLDFH